MSGTASGSTLRCTRCGAGFACDPLGECWCKDESFRLPMPKAAESCLCPKCLRALAAQQEDPPHPILSPRKRVVERGNI